MQTEPLSQFGLRQSQIAAGRSNVHAHDYMRTGIFPQEGLCVQELGSRPRTDYAQRMRFLAANVAKLAKREGGQVPLAEAIGVNQSTVSKWIKGGSTRDMGPIAKMASLAGMSVDQFLNEPMGEPIQEADPSSIIISLPVALPSGAQLTTMMAAMLDSADLGHLADGYASRLARLLPIALAQAVGSGAPQEKERVMHSTELAPDPSTAHPDMPR